MKYSENIEKVFWSRLRDRECLFSFWTHLPHVDRDAEKLAEATVEFQRTFDLDFVKTMPNCLYAIEDYGAEIELSKVAEGEAMQVSSTPFQVVDDWGRIPGSAGSYAKAVWS